MKNQILLTWKEPDGRICCEFAETFDQLLDLVKLRTIDDCCQFHAYRVNEI